MLRYRSRARGADVSHFQWLALPGIDSLLLPRGLPLVLTAHELPYSHLTAVEPAPLPAELDDDGTPVVLCFGLIRPYKGIDVLLEAWRGIEGAQLWIVGRPRYDIAALRAASPPGVRWVTR